jgi:hypothetical protein
VDLSRSNVGLLSSFVIVVVMQYHLVVRFLPPNVRIQTNCIYLGRVPTKIIAGANNERGESPTWSAASLSASEAAVNTSAPRAGSSFFFLPFVFDFDFAFLVGDEAEPPPTATRSLSTTGLQIQHSNWRRHSEGK